MKKGRRALLWACVAVIIVAAVVFSSLARFRNVWWPALFWQLYAVLVVLVFCIPWRTVSLRLVLVAFLAGAGPVMLVTLGLQKLCTLAMERWCSFEFWVSNPLLPWGGYVDSGLVAPLTEELLKIAPLLVFLWWAKKRRWLTLGPLDIAVLAVALGAGFGFAEGMFIAFDQPGLAGGLDWSLHLGPHLGPLFLFPSLTTGIWGGDVVCFDHAGWTGTIGVALGLYFFLRRHRRWTVVLPVVATIWAMWDHYLWNAYGGEPESPSLLLHLLPALDGYGWAMPFTMLIGLAYGMYLSARAVRKYLKADPAVALGQSAVALLRLTLSRPGRLYAFLHARRALAYGARAYKQTGFSDGQLEKHLLLLRAAVLDLRQRLTGSAAPALAPGGAQSAGRAGETS